MSYKIISREKIKIIEIVTLILISFSPLISNPIKAALTLLLVIMNLRVLRTVDAKKFFILFVLMTVFLLSTIYDLRNVSTITQLNILNLYFPLCFLLGYIISEKYSILEFIKFIEKVVFIITIFSIVGVIIYSFFPDVIRYLPTYHYYHTNHKTAYLFNVLLSNGSIIKRNAGIAWEPGAFQFLLNLGVYSYLKLNKEVKVWKIIVYGIAVISTKSTAGLGIYLFITFKVLIEHKNARWIILAIIMIYFNSIKEEIIYQLDYKLYGSFAFENRMHVTINAFKTGFLNPFGLGNSGYDAYLTHLKIGAWDSFGQIFVRYGYPLLIIIISLMTKLFMKDRMLFIIVFISFLSQGVWYFPLITPFYFMWKNDSTHINDNSFLKKEVFE